MKTYKIITVCIKDKDGDNVWIQKEQVDKTNESNKNIVGGGEE